MTFKNKTLANRIYAAVFSAFFCVYSLNAAQIKIDGSSTVFPIFEAAAEEFMKLSPKHQVNVGVSGTGGGFKKFAQGEIDMVTASRSIKSEEISSLKSKNIEYTEIPVAYDGITIVVNPKNTWANDITVEELKKLWSPGSTVKTWSDLRSTWPATPIKLYGPGTDSGTFDYFTEAIVGKAKSSRSDYTKSEDDQILVTAVSGELNALGYFGFAYYEQNQKKLKALPVKNAQALVAPTTENIRSKKYSPLSRPLFVYVNKKSLLKEEISSFVKDFLGRAEKLVAQVGAIPLQMTEYKKLLNSIR